ncbi:lipoyltransferase [Peniophora sp. CONT]|nr:lipoyltransferase [Peniophora sp. CONT]
MTLPPIFYHHFKTPLPYARTLQLQERIHAHQLALRRQSPSSHPDLLLLLEHRPVYTAGRRQTEDETADESLRLKGIGADFERTQRGGQLTFHGPGQLVGYGLLDLARRTPVLGIRDYICQLQTALKLHLSEAHGIETGSSEHTGVFLDEKTKVASIGVQVRHRLTNHGFAMNITREPEKWFDEVVACGLQDVRAGSIAGATGKNVNVEGEVEGVVGRLGRVMGRDVERFELKKGDELGEMIMELEEHARGLETCPSTPVRSARVQ